MSKENICDKPDDFAQLLETKLMDKYGPLLTGKALVKVLGFSTMSALRQAASSGKLDIPIFTPENRRGKFALTIDVANWLAEERKRALSKMSTNNTKRI